MREYISAFAITPINESATIVGLKHKDIINTFNKPPLAFKWIKVLMDGNLKRQLLVAIDHNRKNDINTIIKEVKKEIISRIKNFINIVEWVNLERVKNILAIYCFAVAPENDRWDIVDLTTEDLFGHGIKIVRNFNRDNAEIFISIKMLIKKYCKNIEKEIQEEVFKYIDKQKNLTLKNYG